MFGKGLLKGLAITFKHSFEPDITEQYPEVRPMLAERFRGCLQLAPDKCIVCGLCTRACPNNVLSFETVQKPGSKKKLLRSYTIDLQYCMFCNLCVEACTSGSLYFNHNFELASFNREAIKIVYDFPEALEMGAAGEVELIVEDNGDSDDDSGATAKGPAAGATKGAAAGATTDAAKSVDTGAGTATAADDEEKIRKKTGAFRAAIEKNPLKALARLAGNPEDIELLAASIAGDDKKISMLAGLMAKDMEKAIKVAAGLINKARQNTQKGAD